MGNFILGMKDQQDVEDIVQSIPSDQLDDWKLDKTRELEKTADYIKTWGGAPPDQARHIALLCIEHIARIECRQQNKGFFYRTRRRMQLIKEYLSV